ncbi:MAG: hypothetical protein WCF18_07695 [Chthoniobacteraceae bacterium]
MAFDPNKPQAGEAVDAVLIRAQFNALKALIDAQAQQIANLQASLAAAIAGTANNIPGVSDLSGLGINNPPQTGEVQAMLDKLNEMINALRR